VELLTDAGFFVGALLGLRLGTYNQKQQYQRQASSFKMTIAIHSI
jgi:hypothetical protein